MALAAQNRLFGAAKAAAAAAADDEKAVAENAVKAAVDDGEKTATTVDGATTVAGDRRESAKRPKCDQPFTPVLLPRPGSCFGPQ